MWERYSSNYSKSCQFCQKCAYSQIPTTEAEKKKKVKPEGAQEIDGHYYVCRFAYPKKQCGYEFGFEKSGPGEPDVLDSCHRTELPATYRGCAFPAQDGDTTYSVKRGFETIRNHPRVNSHIMEVPALWKADVIPAEGLARIRAVDAC